MTDPITIASGLTARGAKDLALLLASGGIHAQVDFEVPEAGRLDLVRQTWRVTVAADEVDAALALLQPDEDTPSPPAASTATQLGQRAGLHWVIGLGVINVLCWWSMEGAGGSETHTTLLRYGAITTTLLEQGQWWRAVTAVFVHIGARHLIGNMALLMVLGVLALRTWGPGRLIFLYVLSGVMGNVAGFLFGSAVALKAGASGAILGLLGALAGARLHQMRHASTESRFKPWHVLAMLVAFYGLVVGIRPNSDHVAHVGGLVAGGLIAALWPQPGRLRPRQEQWLQFALGALSMALLVTAGAGAFVATGVGV